MEDAIPGINIKLQQQDQSTTTVEAKVSVIESKILEMEQQSLQSLAALQSLEALKSLEATMDAKIKMAIHMTEGRSQSFAKPILESKAISEVGKLTDAKSYRPWNRKMKNAIDQVRPTGRKVMEMLESITEEMVTNASAREQTPTIKDTIMNVYLARLSQKYPDLEGNLDEVNRDLWSILEAKSEGEALGKLKSVPQGEGLMAYVRLHQWFIRTTDQGQNQLRSAIMHPGQCKHDHEIASAIEEWEEKY